MATYLPSHKTLKYGKQDMLVTAAEVRTNSKETFSYGLLHLDTPLLADQQKLHQLCVNTGCQQENL